MANYVLEETKNSPAISFDFSKGLLEIKGFSVPENSFEFYEPLMKAINDYSSSPSPETTINLFLHYFNTSSSKCILGILKEFSKIHQQGTSVKVNWFYEEDDDDMLEAGTDYSSLVDIPFKVVQKN